MEHISVTDPIGLAIERVRLVLFRPFDLGKWFVLGFCAWLAGLGEQGGSGGHFNSGSHRHGGDIHQEFEHARTYVLENLNWIVPLAIFFVVFIFALAVLIIYLNSRGKFMFLYCVALNWAEVVTPWNHYRHLANSLFWFRLGLMGIGTVITVPVIVFMALTAWPMFRNDSWNFAGIMVLVALFMGATIAGLILLLIRKLTTDFVVPIMYLRGNRCLQAWKEYRQLLASNFGGFVLYLLFQIVIGLVIGVMVLAIILATCCVAGCLLALPYIGTVLFLPVLVFKRAYSLHYLAQYGPNYNVFPPAAATA